MYRMAIWMLCVCTGYYPVIVQSSKAGSSLEAVAGPDAYTNPTFWEKTGHGNNGNSDRTTSTNDKKDDQPFPGEYVPDTTIYSPSSGSGLFGITSAVATLSNVTLSGSECPYREPTNYMKEDIKCPDSFCQHVSYICDAICFEQDKSTHCKFHNCTGSYHCPSGEEVLLAEVCDGLSQCADEDNERRCTHSCTPNCRKCSGLTARCRSDRVLSNDVPYIIDWNSLIRQVSNDFWQSVTYLVVEQCLFGDSLQPSYANISTLPYTVLSRLTRLRYLDLSGTAISTIPYNVFRVLISLYGLDLHDNNISTITENVFQGLTNLYRLDLSENKISTIPENVFRGLTHLYFLDLSWNAISTIPENVFRGLTHLYFLGLSGNAISTIPENVFRGLTNLYFLDLSGNAISTIPKTVFQGLSHLSKLDLAVHNVSAIPVTMFEVLTQLKELYLHDNIISIIPDNLFRGLTNLYFLDLSVNAISTIPKTVFQGLSHLLRLKLSNNNISAIPDTAFVGLAQLTELSLHDNMLSNIPDTLFGELTTLEKLYLGRNNISTIPETVFQGLTHMITLDMSDNIMSTIPNNVFQGLTNLLTLDLAYNNISAIPETVFRGLTQLNTLLLDGNIISIMPETVFRGLTKLKQLYIGQNVMSTLPDNVFSGLSSLQMLEMYENELSILNKNVFGELRNLEYLGLSDNMLTYLSDGTFSSLGKLRTLNIMRNKIKVQERMFSGLEHLDNLLTDSYLICCVRPKSVKANRCVAENDAELCYYGLKVCIAKHDAISSCLNLIRIEVLRICLWIIGLGAFCGNVFVILYRIITDRANLAKSYSLFILNLGISDLLMGVYILIIGGVDVHYQGKYAWNAQKWTQSVLCTAAGILSTISMEMSAFLILMGTVDRFIVIVYPLSRRRITWRQTMSVTAILWLIAIAIAVIPKASLQSYFKEEFYSQSGVCLALPITSGQRPGVEYSFAIFAVLNTVIFMVILIGQICIFKSLRKSGRVAPSQARRREMTVAKLLFFVVATDFSCWFPIGVMSVMSRCGVQIPDDVYAWVMVFVLPINSAVNPFLYTGSLLLRRRCNVKTAVPVTSRSRQQRQTLPAVVNLVMETSVP